MLSQIGPLCRTPITARETAADNRRPTPVFCRIALRQPADTNTMVLAVTERSPLRAAAYHEAGFAVAACDYGRPVRRVTIQPDALGIGAAYVRNLTGIDPSAFVTVAGRDLLERMILTSLSGPAAERWF